MIGRRHLKAISLGCLVGLLPICASARGKGATYDGTVDFGAQVLHLDDGCLSVEGTVASGSFFRNLKRNDAGAEPEYKKDGRVVTQYPASLTTSIRIMGQPCAAALPNSISSIFNGDSYTLSFEVAWKNGMELRPASLSPAIARCTGYRVMTDPNKDSTSPAIACEMTVDSRGISLDKHLIVSVFSSGGARLTRLSAAP
jgi:hypothetical protein